MKIKKLFSIFGLAVSATLVVTNAGCRNVNENTSVAEDAQAVAEAAALEKAEIKNFPLDPYRQLFASSTRFELPELLAAAIQKHTAADVAMVKKFVADEKLLAAEYAELDKGLVGKASDKCYVADAIVASQSLDLAVEAVIIASNPEITREELNKAMADKEFVETIKKLLTSEDKTINDLIALNPGIVKSAVRVLFSGNDKKVMVEEFIKQQEFVKLCGNIELVKTALKNGRPQVKAVNELMNLALTFYASRRYDSMNDADIERRVQENIATRVNELYILVAEKQKTLNMAVSLLEDCRSRYYMIDELEKSRQITPFRAEIEKGRYMKMEELVLKLSAEYKVAALALAEYTGIDSNENTFMLVDDSILDTTVLNDKCCGRGLQLDKLNKIAVLNRGELAFFNRSALLNPAEFTAETSKFFRNNSNAYLKSIYNLIEFKDVPARYDLYFYPEKMEFQKRAPMLIAVLGNVQTNYNLVNKYANYYNNEYNSFRVAKRDFADFVAKNSGVVETDSHMAKIDKKSASDLTILEMDSKRFDLLQQEIKCMWLMSRYYDAWVMLLNAVGDKEITTVVFRSAMLNLDKVLAESGKEFAKEAVEEDGEVSPDTIPTTRFIDVDYVRSYSK